MFCNSSRCSINDTISYKDDESSFTSVHDAILICLGVAIIFSNITVILIYISAKNSLRRKTANLLLCNQAVVDLFHGAVTNGITIFGKSQFLAMQIIYQFSMALSLHTVVLVSVERYLFIVKPLFHRQSMTQVRMRYAVAISWLSSILWIPFRLLHFMDPKNKINWRQYTIYYVAISEAVVFFIILAVIYSYVASYRTVRKFLHRRYHNIKDSLTERDVEGREKSNTTQSMKEIRITKIFTSMFIAFIISHLPVFVTGLVHISVSSSAYTPLLRKIMTLDFTFYLFNCLFNPIVTLTYKEDFKIKCLQVMKYLSCFLPFKYKRERIRKCELVELHKEDLIVCT